MTKQKFTAKGKGKRSETRARYLFRDKASAQSKGWNPQHTQAGGDFLEENEIVAHFPNIGLLQDRPDFLLTIGGAPCVAVETKNERHKISQAIAEAVDYADIINNAGKYKVCVAADSTTKCNAFEG